MKKILWCTVAAYCVSCSVSRKLPAKVPATFQDSVRLLYAYANSFHRTNATYDMHSGYDEAVEYLDSLHEADASYTNRLLVRSDPNDTTKKMLFIRDDIEGTIGTHVISEDICFYLEKSAADSVILISSSYTMYERYGYADDDNRLVQSRKTTKADIQKVMKRIFSHK